jgi:GAF domain-containing protein
MGITEASQEQAMNNPSFGPRGGVTKRYALLGVFFGIMFPVLGTFLEMVVERLPVGWTSIIEVQRNNPLLWIIDTAPLFLGLLAALAGRRQDAVYEANAALAIRESQMQTVQESVERQVHDRTLELEEANRQIARRAAQLKTITELSEAIADVQDLNELLPAVTRLISEQFGFYHVGIFLVDRDREYAVLQAANSEGGERMLRRAHRLRLSVGVVGFCAQTGQPRIALDVGTDAVFFNNPDLPETHSEVALPLEARGETIGVLDVQSTETGAFSAEDLQVLTALANQVSIALENARLLTEARAAYTQMQEVYNEFTRVEWSRAIAQTRQAGFRYQAGRIELLENPMEDPEVISAVEAGEVVVEQSNGSAERRPVLAVPVKLRGEIIGVLHVESSDPVRQWQDEEVSLIQAVAERVALAMENARLFQDARRRAAKERLISEATSRISNAFNVENILQATAEELERVLGGSEISIQFQSRERS